MLRVGVIGLGVIGSLHVDTISKTSGLKLVAVTDVNKVEARRVGSEREAKWYTDYRDMLDKEQLDIVSICVPHFLHERIAVDAARRGVNVILEKPMATRIKEADRIIEEARKRRVKLGVLFQQRFRPVIAGAKKAIDEQIRPLFRFLLEYNIFRGSAYYSSAAWRGTWAGEGGGILINQGIHHLDLLQYLVGTPPLTTYATASTVLHDIQVEDMANAVIEFRDGVQGVVQLTTIDAPQLVRLEFRGQGGIVALDERRGQISVNSPSLREQMTSTKGLFESPECRWSTFVTDRRGQNYHALFYKDFLDAVQHDRKPLIDGREGRKALELTNAMIYSAVTGKPVKHPLDSDRYDGLFFKLVKAKRLLGPSHK